MYEMEGPRLGLMAFRRADSSAAPRRGPATGPGHVREAPVSRASRVPRVAPGWWPPVVVKQFYCLAADPHKGFPRPAP